MIYTPTTREEATKAKGPPPKGPPPKKAKEVKETKGQKT